MRRHDMEREMRSGGTGRHSDPRHGGRHRERDDERRGESIYDDERGTRRSMGFLGERQRGAYGRETLGDGPHAWYGSADDAGPPQRHGEQYYGGGSGRQYAGFGDYESERAYAGGYYGQDDRPSQPYGDTTREAGWRGESPRYDEPRRHYGRQYDRGYGQGYGDDTARYGGPRDDERYGDYRSDAAGPRRHPGGYHYGTQADGGAFDAYGRPIGAYGRLYDRPDATDFGQRSTENYRGRGPKNYTRADERIKEDLCERLSDAETIDAGDISIDVKNGVVTLTGTVDARYVKYRVEDIADRCGGVKDVQNFLTVKTSASDAPSPRGQGAGAASRHDESTKKH